MTKLDDVRRLLQEISDEIEGEEYVGRLFGCDLYVRGGEERHRRSVEKWFKSKTTAAKPTPPGCQL